MSSGNDLRVAAVVVTYNVSVADSVTCTCLAACPGVDVIVVDNGAARAANREACQARGMAYVPMGENAGLSRAYNAALEHPLIRGLAVHDLIVLFDDDTEVPAGYFDELRHAACAHPEVEVFAPVVMGQDGVIYSPNHARFMRNRLITSLDESVGQGDFNAIASCLALRRSVFDGYWFDERLFVDQIDQNLFDDLRARGTRFMKLDQVIHQQFYQRAATLSPEAGWRRLRLRIIDMARYARMKGGVRYRALGYLKSCGLGAQIARKTRSPRVFIRAVALSTAVLIHPR